jgi:hypothetical protein
MSSKNVGQPCVPEREANIPKISIEETMCKTKSNAKEEMKYESKENHFKD